MNDDDEMVYDETSQPEALNELDSDGAVIYINDEGPQPSYRSNVRLIIKTIYGVQKLRIATGNRVFALFCKRFGYTFESKITTKEYDNVIKNIQLSYYRIIDGISDQLSEEHKKKKIAKKDHKDLLKNLSKIKIPEGELIQTVNEMILIHQYLQLLESQVPRPKGRGLE